MGYIPYKNHKIRAQGLIEMLIAMAIYAIAVIGITALNASNFRTIKDNELEDLANQHMVKTLEYFKAGTTGEEGTVQQIIEAALQSTTYNFPLDDTVCFKVDSKIDDLTGEKIAISQIDEHDNPCIPMIVNCPTVYKLTADDAELSGFQVCNQIVITKVIEDPGAESGYKITSRINYQLGNRRPATGDVFVNEIIGFRPFTY